MNSNLANQLLASIMKWDAQTLASERAALEFMGSMKYDAYDRYMPGMRFMSSLVQWLNDIEEEDRDEAYKFIKEKLVFISSTQMNYLVDLLYDSKIRPILLDMATTETGMPSYKRSSQVVRNRFEIEKRSALVVGLSDGAHTDILRRSAGFNNEQVLTNYYPDGKKLKDMLEELRKDEKLKGIEKPYFRRIFLIDDFTASGKSFIRYDEQRMVTMVREKEVISNEATVGIYNYRHGKDFVAAAHQMIDQNIRVNGEFYVAPVYNEMIRDGKKITFHNIGEHMYGLGIPEDLEAFVKLPISRQVFHT